jgi:hypothetical protein
MVDMIDWLAGWLAGCSHLFGRTVKAAQDRRIAHHIVQPHASQWRRVIFSVPYSTVDATLRQKKKAGTTCSIGICFAALLRTTLVVSDLTPITTRIV